MLIGYFALTPLLQPRVSTASFDSGALPPLIVPASATLIVRPQAAMGQRMQGKILLAADIEGRAPVSGAVAKWLVKPGQRVEKGQPVVQISSGAASKPAPQAEVHQDRAERAQIEAAQNQLDLARQMSLAQSQLRAAQERVKRAQSKVSSARALISQIQASSEKPAASAESSTPQAVQVPNPAYIRAQAELKAMQSSIEAAKRAHKIAESDGKAAQKALSDAQKSVGVAELKVAAVERDFDAGKATGADVQNARSDKEDALAKIVAAQSRFDEAKKTLEGSALAPLLAKLNSARKALESTPETLEAATSGAPVKAPDQPEDFHPALERAVARAQKALIESRDAAREAERLAARVKLYETRAQTSNQEIESASQQLQNAQQQVLESVPRPIYTHARAPQSGVIVWISRLATEVGSGDGVFGLAQGKQFKVRFKVRTKDWQRVKIGDRLPAALNVSDAVAPGVAPIQSPDQTLPAHIAPTPQTSMLDDITFDPSAVTTSSGEAVEVVVRQIGADPSGEENSNQSAIIEGDLKIPGHLAVSPREAQQISAFLPAEGAPKIWVPISSIVQKEGRNFVALLRQVNVPDDTIFQMNWQSVRLGQLAGAQREVEGLTAGSRILAKPLSVLPNATSDQSHTSRVTIQIS